MKKTRYNLIKTYFHCIIAIITICLQTPFAHAETHTDDIILSIPEAVLVNAANKAMPITINRSNKLFSGNINLIKITDFSLDNNNIYCQITLDGQDMAITSSLGGRDFKINIKSATINFTISNSIRFDPQNKILFIKPVFSNINSSIDSKQSPVSPILLGLLNNREFPIKIQRLKPIVAKIAANNKLFIHMDIIDIKIINKNMQIVLRPSYAKKTN